MIHLVQIGNGTSRRVALVDEPHLRCLTEVESVYELAQLCLGNSVGIEVQALKLAHGEVLDYDAIYTSTSEWHLLAPIDVPGNPSRLMIAGTGLTHLGSAKDRQAMHTVEAAKVDAASAEAAKDAEVVTDSMRMFQWGVEGGRPAPGEIGTAPEWFFKGNGTACAHPSRHWTFPPTPKMVAKKQRSQASTSLPAMARLIA